MVAGALSLAFSMKPDLTVPQAIDALTRGVDPFSFLDGKVKTGGRLNVYKVLQNVATTYGSYTATLIGDDGANATNDSLVVQIKSGSGGTKLELVRNGVSLQTVDNVGTTVIGIFGLGGNDSISIDEFAGTIAAKIYVNGGSGNDTVTGGSGNDTILGDVGDDNLTGASGNDFIYGGTGNDTIDGSAGNDTIDGYKGADYLLGGKGNDTITGGDDNDAIYGYENSDLIHGNDGFDTLWGDRPDNVTLNAGADTLWGDAGTSNWYYTQDGIRDDIMVASSNLLSDKLKQYDHVIDYINGSPTS